MQHYPCTSLIDRNDDLCVKGGDFPPSYNSRRGYPYLCPQDYNTPKPIKNLLSNTTFNAIIIDNKYRPPKKYLKVTPDHFDIFQSKANGPQPLK